MKKLRTLMCRKIHLFTLILFAPLLLIFNSSVVAQNKPSHSTILKDLQFEKINFKPRKIKREILHKSKLLLLEDNNLPYLDLVIVFPNSGILHEPVSQAGLFVATLQLMEKGGAGGMSAEKTAQFLSNIGARLNISHSQDHWQISLKVLTSQFDSAFKILSDTLLKPTLEKKIYNSIIQNMKSGIDRRNQKPSSIAHRKLREIMYFGKRPGYTLQKKDINRLNYNSLQKNIKNVINTRSPLLAISGDIRNTNVRARLTELLKKLPTLDQAPQNPIDSKTIYKQSSKRFHNKIFLIEKDVPQSIILMSSFIPAKSSSNFKDFYALQVGNYILGGGSFNSRLMKEIRVNRGLAYYAYSYNIFLNSHGRFLAGTATRKAKTAESFKLMRDIILSMQKNISKNELHLAKQSILNSLVFAFDSPQKRISSEMTFLMQGLNKNYLERFPDNIRKQNIKTIKKAYRNRIKTSELFSVVVGPASIKKGLEAFGEVIILQPEQSIPAN